MIDETPSSMRVIPAGSPGEAVYENLRPERSVAQQRRDDILNDAEGQLRAARDLVAEAVEGIEMLMTPQHKDIELKIGQMIEQVIEFRRAKR